MSDPTTQQPTYKNPGSCPKCGYPYPQIWWQPPDTHGPFGYTATGQLTATCHACGYEWRVLAKDEIG